MQKAREQNTYAHTQSKRKVKHSLAVLTTQHQTMTASSDVSLVSRSGGGGSNHHHLPWKPLLGWKRENHQSSSSVVGGSVTGGGSNAMMTPLKNRGIGGNHAVSTVAIAIDSVVAVVAIVLL